MVGNTVIEKSNNSHNWFTTVDYVNLTKSFIGKMAIIAVFLVKFADNNEINVDYSLKFTNLLVKMGNYGKIISKIVQNPQQKNNFTKDIRK